MVEEIGLLKVTGILWVDSCARLFSSFMSVAFATEFGADGRCVRVASISSHGAVLTAHETGVLVLRSASDLSVVIARATVLDAHVLSEGTPAAPACIYDAAVSTDQQWCIASAGDGVVCKTARFALPSLSFLDNVASTALPARALAISPDNAVMYVMLIIHSRFFLSCMHTCLQKTCTGS